jgi:murein L,D-transpeptidase YafK
VSASAGGSGPSLPYAGSSSFEMAERIVVEKASRRLMLLRGGDVIATYPVKLGLNPYGHKQREGDFRTPEGSYHLSRRNPRSEFFLSLEVSYPSPADRARARSAGVPPGGLIMIHGQPNIPRKPAEYYVSNDWTDGCIAVSNSDMVDIWLRTRIGIPIEIRP